MLWLKLSQHYRVYSVTSSETSFSAILVGLGKLAGCLCVLCANILTSQVICSKGESDKTSTKFL